MSPEWTKCREASVTLTGAQCTTIFLVMMKTQFTYKRESLEYYTGGYGTKIAITERVWGVYVSGIRIGFMIDEGAYGGYTMFTCEDSYMVCGGDTLRECKDNFERVFIGIATGNFDTDTMQWIPQPKSPAIVERDAVLASALAAAYELKRLLKVLDTTEWNPGHSQKGYREDIRDVNNVLCDLMPEVNRSNGVR
jgi:hypothetical protein